MPRPTEAYRAEPRPDVHALTVRRAHRRYRVPIRTSGPDERSGFGETVLGYTADEAVAEASRCLDCDVLCSLCVGVCPNLALVTYESEVRDGSHIPGEATPFHVGQRFQVAVLTDLCNECGTCVTACPTAGRPYVDKPRLYLDAADFEAEVTNAFRILDPDRIEGRFEGATHRLAVGRGEAEGRLLYEAPGLRAVLDRSTFAVLEASAEADTAGGTRSLAPAATMATLLDGIAGSLPHLPVAATGAGGTRVPAPLLP
jgi:putative selenate reductase